MAAGAEATLVARKRQPCWTRNEPDSWLCMDLGRNRLLRPTYYTLCHGCGEPGMDLVAWAIEGFRAEANIWIDLSGADTQGGRLQSPWGVKTFRVEPQGAKYRYLRVRITGPNARGTYELPICAIEFYGQLFRA